LSEPPKALHQEDKHGGQHLPKDVNRQDVVPRVHDTVHANLGAEQLQVRRLLRELLTQRGEFPSSIRHAQR
jgi:hypothetical protein